MPDKKSIRNKDIYERLAIIETKLEIYCEKVATHMEKNDNEHNDFVSTKVFAGWLSTLAVAIGIITTILLLIN